MSITTTQPQPEKKSISGQMIALALVIVFAAATNVYLFSRMKSLEVEAHTLRTQIDTEIAKVHESSAYRNIQARREFEDLREEVKKTRSQITKETDANTRVRTRSLADNVAKKQREQQEMLLGEIRVVSGKAGEVQQGVDEVRTDVQAMQSDAEETRAQLNETGAMLRSTHSHVMDLDGQVSGNAAGIENLRKLGERERIGFALKKTDRMQRVGGIYLRLKNTSPKNNRFTLEVMADDKKVEQRKKHIHEAMRFYLPGSAQPYDIVITAVRKDQVNGYVSRPKLHANRIATMASR
jgi:chromosome segregation ATPase